MNSISPYTKSEHTETNSRLWPIVTMWTSWDVERFINDIGYAKYAKCFSRNAIDGHDLLTTNAFDLQRLGISRMEDAIKLDHLIKQAATTMAYNEESPNEPPNTSYNKGNMPCSIHKRYTPDVIHQKGISLPPLPINMNYFCVPYRDRGDRLYRYEPPIQAYHDHCMVMGRKDAWKLYNSEF